MATPAISSRPKATYILKYQMNLDIAYNLTIDSAKQDKPKVYRNVLKLSWSIIN